MVSALAQQVLILAFPATILDGGLVGQMCFYAAVAFWGGVAVILFRRRLSPTKLDLILIHGGYLTMCILSFFLTQAIWKWRGL